MGACRWAYEQRLSLLRRNRRPPKLHHHQPHPVDLQRRCAHGRCCCHVECGTYKKYTYRNDHMLTNDRLAATRGRPGCRVSLMELVFSLPMVSCKKSPAKTTASVM